MERTTELPRRWMTGSRFPSVILGGMLAGMVSSGVRGAPPEFAIGADLSFLQQAEADGIRFHDNGIVRSGLDVFRDHGFQWIRLRLFHSPDRLPNDLEYTRAFAQVAKGKGYKFLLDYHYSDTWADPGKQFLPRAWERLTPEQLVDELYRYTRDTIRSLHDAGAGPNMVQIGNEISAGMLWPHGKLPENWDRLAAILQAGIRGVRDGSPTDQQPRIMIHIDKGGDQSATKWFFDKVVSYDIEFDVIGQSFYPWWHGSLEDLNSNLAFMAERYGKDIMLVEAAYCWRPTEYRDRPGPYPETPEGQRQYWLDVAAAVRATPNHRGIGVFWWEPAVARGPIHSRGLFDDDYQALPALDALHAERVDSGQ